MVIALHYIILKEYSNRCDEMLREPVHCTQSTLHSFVVPLSNSTAGACVSSHCFLIKLLQLVQHNVIICYFSKSKCIEQVYIHIYSVFAHIKKHMQPVVAETTWL